MMGLNLFRSKLFWLILGIIMVGLIGLSYYRDSKFRLTGTVPAQNAMAVLTPEVDINFNRNLSDQGLAVTTNPQIIIGQKISGKRIILQINSLEVNKEYTINVASVQSVDGKKLINQVIKFKAKDIAFKDLPNGVQKIVLENQQQNKGSFSFGYENVDGLLDYGVSAQQLSTLKSVIYRYASSANPSFSKVSVDTTSISTPPRDPDTATPVFSIFFSISFDKTNYKARLDYSQLSNIRLFLSDPKTGNQVFDSGEQAGG